MKPEDSQLRVKFLRLCLEAAWKAALPGLRTSMTRTTKRRNALLLQQRATAFYLKMRSPESAGTLT